LDSVYSCVQQTRVLPGSAASARQRGVHLRRRAFEQPAAAGAENSVSPQNSSGAQPSLRHRCA
jgi:hypothetical protein